MGILDMFDRFRETIILKENCELEQEVKKLEELHKNEPNNKEINQQLYMAKKGVDGEKEIIYQLKKANIGMFVLHDINIEYEDLKAKIDFIVITPWCCYFIECKNLIGNITVNENGDFIREYNFNGHKIKKGMDSPYRQVQAQREVYKKIWLEKIGKFRSFLFEKDFDNMYRVLVVASNGENILNTKYAPKDMKNNIIKADGLIRKLEYDRDHSNKDLWDNEKNMRQWAESFIKLNVKKESELQEVIIHKEAKKCCTNAETESDLKTKLIEFRKQRSNEKNIPAYYVFNNEELEKILKYRPKTIENLQKLNILTSIKVKSHGKEIIEIINNSKV